MCCGNWQHFILIHVLVLEIHYSCLTKCLIFSNYLIDHKTRFIWGCFGLVGVVGFFVCFGVLFCVFWGGGIFA